MLQALGRLVYFNNVTSHTQIVLAGVFGDRAWVDEYIARNTTALRSMYNTLTSALTAVDIPFVPAQAGMFVWIDLRRWLPEPTWEGEWTLFSQLANEAHVVLTPGKDCHAEEPGFFRCCFAAMPAECLPVAVDRMAQVLK
jgi:1-aminocyclopropane-1-carboxylate synthase